MELPAKDVELCPATVDQEPILANLLELYAHDFSEFTDVELGPDGRFGWRDLSLYWRDPNRHPFLARVNGRLAGLAMVKKGSYILGTTEVWDMAEFFVMRGFRKRGVGTQLATEVWRHFPGWWEIRVTESNKSAFDFWQHAIAQYTGDTVYAVPVEKDGKCWDLFSFESKGVLGDK